ncbi:hypothetical protein RA262_27675, partial [Pseudomonas syringae pv. tagetis]
VFFFFFLVGCVICVFVCGWFGVWGCWCGGVVFVVLGWVFGLGGLFLWVGGVLFLGLFLVWLCLLVGCVGLGCGVVGVWGFCCGLWCGGVCLWWGGCGGVFVVGVVVGGVGGVLVGLCVGGGLVGFLWGWKVLWLGV